MPTGQLDRVVQRLRATALAHAAVPTDGQLLERFITSGEEAAFAVLVQRHGPMVLGVCGRVLRNAHDAEDAFQAAFLVLFRKAPSIARRELLANWLYGVACRTAQEAKRRAARRRAWEARAMHRPDMGTEVAPDLREVLDEELSRMPARYRAAIVLCDMEGLTRQQAAERIGCPEGTVSSRLARGRALLRRRLGRRGVGPRPALLAAALGPAAVPCPLAAATARAAAGLASAEVLALTEGVLKAMFLSKLKIPLTGLLALAVVGAGLLLAAPATTFKPGDTLAIHLPPALLAEAEKPGIPVTISFVDPGPERLIGHALRDLRDYLQRMTRAQHPFEKRNPDAKTGLFAGTFEQFPDFEARQAGSRAALASADPEAFVIEVQGGKLFLLGKSTLGLQAAIYTFLDNLGCKWFAPGKAWENVPDRTGLALDDRLNAASAGPSYRFRWFAPSWGPDVSVFRKEDRTKYAHWLRRNRQGGSAYVANFHNDPALVPPALFDKRPELFALVKGKRNPYGLSRANPDTVAQAVASAVKYLKANEGKGSFFHSISVETNDGSPACEWSLKRMARDGTGKPTATDLNYRFANQVAAGIDRAGLKDRWVGMCSYSDHATLPSFDLHPRVAVAVTNGLAWSDDGGPIGLTVEQRLEGLRRRGCRRVGVYDYPDMVTWTRELPGCGTAMASLDFAAALKRYHAHGATSYTGETSDSWINAGAGRYLGSRLLWDVRGDPKKELDAYYRGAFGPAAAEVRALNEDWERYPRAVGALPRMPRDRCAKWYGLIAAAERKVRAEPTYRARVRP